MWLKVESEKHQLLQRTEAYKRERWEGENNTTEQSFSQHPLLTDHGCNIKSGLDQCRHSMDLNPCYLLCSFDVLMSFDWACMHFQSLGCVLTPAAFKTLFRIKHRSQHVVIIAAVLMLEYGTRVTLMVQQSTITESQAPFMVLVCCSTLAHIRQRHWLITHE